ncbi:hypothetical protein EG834_09540 [bacterium]|nr:hypothetical protein [bacterium]
MDTTKNPGDIRLVTDGTTSWMTGPGIDGECVQFPNGQGFDPNFLTPVSFIKPQEVVPNLGLVGEETAAGHKALHYSSQALNAGRWQNPKIDLWLDTANGALLRYELTASGTDILFSAGTGSLTIHYEVMSLEEPAIETVLGCEPPIPLPADAQNYVRLPDLVSFNSPTNAVELRTFYQQALPQEGWVEAEVPAEAEGKLVLSYLRESTRLEISLQVLPPGGTKARLLFFTE